MKKYLALVCIGVALLIAGCGEKPEDGSSIVPRFTITEAELDSWEEGNDFVKLTLTPVAAEGFAEFTKAHMNQKIDVFYGDRKLMSPEIKSEAKPPDVYLSKLDEAAKKDILRLMPPEKNGADKTTQ